MEKVVISYTANGIKVSRQFLPKAGNPPKVIKIAASTSKSWQNGRKYNEEGDVIYISGKVPKKLDFELFFEGCTDPVSISKELKPFSEAFQLPFKTSDLKKDEYWSGGSTHGSGGGQAFAYDLGVNGYSDGSWSGNLPGKDGTENNHKRVWCKNFVPWLREQSTALTMMSLITPSPG